MCFLMEHVPHRTLVPKHGPHQGPHQSTLGDAASTDLWAHINQPRSHINRPRGHANRPSHIDPRVSTDIFCREGSTPKWVQDISSKTKQLQKCPGKVKGHFKCLKVVFWTLRLRAIFLLKNIFLTFRGPQNVNVRRHPKGHFKCLKVVFWALTLRNIFVGSKTFF